YNDESTEPSDHTLILEFSFDWDHRYGPLEVEGYLRHTVLSPFDNDNLTGYGLDGTKWDINRSSSVPDGTEINDDGILSIDLEIQNTGYFQQQVIKTLCSDSATAKYESECRNTTKSMDSYEFNHGDWSSKSKRRFILSPASAHRPFGTPGKIIIQLKIEINGYSSSNRARQTGIIDIFLDDFVLKLKWLDLGEIEIPLEVSKSPLITWVPIIVPIFTLITLIILRRKKKY
ncbi:MAG: hypothetical protein ACXAC7_10765, partial [Candidatus Hodarchaeales archaeon]